MTQEGPPADAVCKDGSTELEVESIVGDHVVHGRAEYLVQFEATGREQTYEPQEHWTTIWNEIRNSSPTPARFTVDVQFD